MRNIFHDLRYAARMLAKSPGFTTVAILTLALGIGGNTTIFSWIRTVLLDPLPGAGHPERIVALETIAPSGEWFPTSYPDFRDFRDHTKLMESMTVAEPMALAFGNDLSAERVWGELVSGNFFDLLQVQPELGRFFVDAERDEAQNAHPVVVISHSFWKSHFHSDPSVAGTVVKINHHPFAIIGVAPESFHGSMPGLRFDVWVPATMYSQLTSLSDWFLRDRKTRMFRVLARLAPGVQIDQARSEMQSTAAAVAKEHADTNEGITAAVLPMWKSHYGIQDSLREPLSLLMGIGVVVLLVVCANLANLMLARGTHRKKELSIRFALGATRVDVARQILAEICILSAIGSILALFFASWFAGALRFLLPPSAAPTMEQPAIAGSVLWFSLGLVFLTALLAGLIPTLHAARTDINEALLEGGRSGTAGMQAQRLRGLFVIAEVALALVALTGAGLFVKSYYTTKAVQTGFNSENVALGRFNLSAGAFDAKQADEFCRRMRERLEAQPGVTSVAYSDYIPLSLSAGSWEDLQVQGYVPGPGESMKIYRNLVSPGFFDVLKIPLLEGRDFNALDDTDHPPVMIVSREFVRRFLPKGNVIGAKVNGWGDWFTVVGIAEDTKINRLTENPIPYFYVPIRQIYRPEMGLAFFVRTSGSPDIGIATLQREANAVDPTVPLFDTVSLNDYTATSLFSQRITANLLPLLGSLACILAAIGLYGVIAYFVAQRTHEFGIRIALGAQPRDILGLVLTESARLTLIGLVLGLILAALSGRIVANQIYGINFLDPLAFGVPSLLLVAVAFLASYIPARRAMRVEPTVALRYE
jgi:predicted permease